MMSPPHIGDLAVIISHLAHVNQQYLGHALQAPDLEAGDDFKVLDICR
jgi:hypothetical protein